MTSTVPNNAIVIGVDGSTESWNALRWAADRADEGARPLHVLHARGALSSWSGPELSNEPVDNICDEAVGIVARHHPDLVVTWSQPPRSPVPALTDASRAASEVVLGARGTGAVRGAVLGSVATGVSATAYCPVLTTRRAIAARQCDKPVVAGVDLGPDGLAALDFAFAEAERRGVPLVAVRCWQLDRWDFASGIPMPGGNMRAAQQHHRALLEEALARPVSRHPNVHVTTQVMSGRTAGALVERSAGASLLVVGTRGHREVAGVVLGSVSQSVMRRALCPVAVVAHLAADGARAGNGTASSSASAHQHTAS